MVDLDSLCSAIVLAYLRTHSPPHTLHIPISNLPRDDLSLRPEMAAVLSHAGLASDDPNFVAIVPVEIRKFHGFLLLADYAFACFVHTLRQSGICFKRPGISS